MLLDPAEDEGIEILNGDFSAGAANWNLVGGWTIHDGYAHYQFPGIVAELAQPNLGMIPGNVYTIQFTITEYIPSPPPVPFLKVVLGLTESAPFDSVGLKTAILSVFDDTDQLTFEIFGAQAGYSIKLDNVSITRHGDYFAYLLGLQTTSPKGISFGTAVGADMQHLITGWKDKTNVRILYNLP